MPAKMKGHVYIGTSNVVIPGNKKSFPLEFQSTSRLYYYSRLFNSVEINQSFYKLPLRKTYEKWAMEVGPDFKFSVKLSKEITHVKNLKSDLTLLEQFFETSKGIGIKKGCLLVQFPGKITLDYFSHVEQILRALQEYDQEGEWRKTVEFRHPSWYIGECWELLDEYSAGVVLQDHPKAKLSELKGKASFVYIRFHGPSGDYRDSYSSEYLHKWAKEIKDWIKSGKDVYVYFNNTIGNAFENARTLQQLF